MSPVALFVVAPTSAPWRLTQTQQSAGANRWRSHPGCWNKSPITRFAGHVSARRASSSTKNPQVHRTIRHDQEA